jgi:hypothetical protein
VRRAALALALLAAIAQPAGAAPGPPRTPFVEILVEANFDAMCYPRGCPVVPLLYDPAEIPSDRYSVEFRLVLARFLLDVGYRGQVDPKFTDQDRRLFTLSLSALEPYLACLERRFEAAPAQDYASRAAIDGLASAARQDCRVMRDAALRAAAFAGPDIDSFDPLRDGGKPEAQVSELL